MKDGGPAFPVITSESIRRVPEGHREEVAFHTAPGMSLRDWFAGQAMSSLMIRYAKDSPETYARMAYVQADAMLAARERGI